MIVAMMNLRLSGTIEIDEAVITGRRKYNRGRYRRIYWIFGLYSREQQKCYAFLSQIVVHTYYSQLWKSNLKL